MAAFLEQQADYLAFVVGLGVMCLGALCFSLCGRDRRIPWLWLGLATLGLGLSEWLGLVIEGVPGLQVLRDLPFAILIIACIFSAEFIRTGLVGVRGRGPGRWVLLPLVAVLAFLRWWSPPALLLFVNSLLVPFETMLGGLVFLLVALANRSRQGRSLLVVGTCSIGVGVVGLMLGGLPQLGVWPAPPAGVQPLLMAVITSVAVSALVIYWAGTWFHTRDSRHIRSRLRSSVALSVVLTLVLSLGWLFAQKLGEQEEGEVRADLLARTASVATALPLSWVQDLAQDQEKGSEASYVLLQNLLHRVRVLNPDCRRLYLIGRQGMQLFFYASAESKVSPSSSVFGKLYPEASSQLRGLFEGDVAFVEGPLRDREGLWVSGLAPIRDPLTKRTVAVLGMDIDAQIVAQRRAQARILGIAITASICILVLTFFLSLQRFADFTAQLGDSERRYRTLLESSPNAIMLVDATGQLLSVNRYGLDHYWRLRNLSPETDFVTMFSAETQPYAQKAVVETLAGHPVQFEADCLGPGGALATWQVMLNPLADEPRVTRFVAIAVDITERKRYERELADTVERLTAVNEIARAVASTLDQGRIMRIVVREVRRVMHSDGVALMTCEPDTYVGRILGVEGDGAADPVAGPGAEVDFLKMGLVQAAREGRHLYLPDLSLDSQPIPQRLVELGIHSSVAVPIVCDGLLIGCVCVARRERDAFSFEDRRLLESLTPHLGAAVNNARTYEQLRLARADLEKAQEQMIRVERLRGIGEVASGVAHDFNNLLGIILARTQMLLERTADEAIITSLQTIEAAARDGRDTVRRIQQFAGKHNEEAMVGANLDQIVEEAVSMTAYRWKDEAELEGRSITVETELGAAPQVRVNPAEIREVLMNLLLNACDAMPEGGRIYVRTSSAPGCGSFEVADSGVGMDEATLARATDLFFSTKGASSTGLGLAICQGIIQRHGGTMTVCSERGQGTFITVSLPLADEPPAAKEAPPNMEEVPPTDLRVLVVDDDVMVLAAMREALDTVGYPALGAPDGPTAVAMARQQPFDVVISDLGMPGMSGWQVAEEIKSFSPQTQVLILTGWGDTIESTRYVEETLTKPVELAELREIMLRAAERKAA